MFFAGLNSHISVSQIFYQSMNAIEEVRAKWHRKGILKLLDVCLTQCGIFKLKLDNVFPILPQQSLVVTINPITVHEANKWSLNIGIVENTKHADCSMLVWHQLLGQRLKGLWGLCTAQSSWKICLNTNGTPTYYNAF